MFCLEMHTSIIFLRHDFKNYLNGLIELLLNPGLSPVCETRPMLIYVGKSKFKFKSENLQENNYQCINLHAKALTYHNYPEIL